MKWPRLRFTVRRMMVLVVVLGLAAHLGITAWRVRRLSDQHVHTAITDDDPIPGWVFVTRPPPFWPTYWRAVLGRSWKDWPLERPLCWGVHGWLDEMCELANPEIRKDVDPPGSFSAVFTKKQKDLYIQLARKKGRNAHYTKDGHVGFSYP